MTINDFFAQLRELRLKVNAAIQYQREVRHEPGKSYEGIFEVTLAFPEQYDDPQATAPPDWCKIVLHCYLIGPSRHYEWTDASMEKALERCRNDVEQWCEEVYEEDA